MPDNNNKVQQKTCLLMASAAGIEAVMSIIDENEKVYAHIFHLLI